MQTGATWQKMSVMKCPQLKSPRILEEKWGKFGLAHSVNVKMANLKKML